MQTIPFNRPLVLDAGYRYLREAVEQGHLSGDGPFTRRCHDLLESLVGVPRALLTTSCTHALELAALLLDIQPGDEVIVPSFTFVTTVNAFVVRGAQPVFCDIRPDTLNMDESQLKRLITRNTKAIIPVHYAGIGCDMNAIMAIAQRHSVPVVEDNAHGLFGRYAGQALGTFGCLSTLSFHETKNLNCGEGGALLINDARLIERAEIIRAKGTDRSRFFRGQVDKYTWRDLGSSYSPSDALAALLCAQLEDYENIQSRRCELWQRYESELATWADAEGVRLPVVPAECQQAYHLFYLLLPTLEQRQAFITHLRGHGIHAVFHYLPLHLSEMGQRLGGHAGDCPVTESISDRLVRLPLFYDLCDADQTRVIEATCSFQVQKGHGDVRDYRRAA